jgi:hypothetical protein
MEVDQELLFKIMHLAHYLDMPALLDLGCCKLATMLKGTTTRSCLSCVSNE